MGLTPGTAEFVCVSVFVCAKITVDLKTLSIFLSAHLTSCLCYFFIYVCVCVCVCLCVCETDTSLWEVGFYVETFGGGSSRTAHTRFCAA